MALLGAVLILTGGSFAGLMWRSFQRARAMEQWPRVEAQVLSSGVAERRIGPAGRPEFRFEVLFGYAWHGTRHTSERWTLRGSPWSARPSDAADLAARFPAGAAVECRVDPADPAVAVLKTDSRGPGYAIWFPLLFVAAGVGIIAGALRRRCRSIGDC